MILLWGSPEDGPLHAVDTALRAIGADVLFLHEEQLMRSRLVTDAEPWRLVVEGREYALNDVRACYPRPFVGRTETRHPSVERHLARLESMLWKWLAQTPALVVNRPAAGVTNSTKTGQTAVAATCGLRVPPSLVTTDANRYRGFAERWGRPIYKAAGGARTIVTRVGADDDNRLRRLGTCPTYFQAFIPGTNVRVHVVGEQMFAAEIHSDKVDYRFGECAMNIIELPARIADNCRLICRRLDLALAGIDLIRTDDDDWYFLEANTSPAFTFFPQRERIAAVLADLLANGSLSVLGTGRSVSSRTHSRAATPPDLSA